MTTASEVSIFTQVLGPPSLGIPSWRIAICRKIADKWERHQEINCPEELKQSPNLSLLWHRYMPARGPRAEGADLVNTLSLRVEAPELQDDQRNKRIKEAIDQWKGHGALSWFVETAQAAMSQPFLRENGLFDHIFHRRRTAVQQCGAHAFVTVAAPWRVAVGLGNASTFENSGVALDQTYGIPVLPGSSLKGLVHHYFAEECFPAAADFEFGGMSLTPDEATIELLFGRPAQEKRRATEGVVAFWDGWPQRNEKGWFDVDVLTVHHPKYYGGRIETAIADDTDNTNPVHFLTLAPGIAFEIPLTMTSSAHRFDHAVQVHLLWFAAFLLRGALERWGIGAKTGAGYGRLQSE